MHRRFVCEGCHMKWFVPVDAPRENDPAECSGCGGALKPIAAPTPGGFGAVDRGAAIVAAHR